MYIDARDPCFYLGISVFGYSTVRPAFQVLWCSAQLAMHRFLTSVRRAFEGQRKLTEEGV